MNKSFYKGKRIFISGGAGFIGSHLLDKLIKLGAIVTVGDNLSTGSLDNIIRVWKSHKLKHKKKNGKYIVDGGHSFVKVDFQELKSTAKAIKDHEIVFHLAASIGGRGYIDAHPALCCENFAINQNVIKASYLNKVDRIQFASTACIYPVNLQKDYGSKYLLKESDAFKNNLGNADEEYGWAKLMGELMLRAYHEEYNLRSSITRYVTAYGPWENDTHAIIALIKRAVQKQEPYVIWGSGQQDRDFTYVDDIVSGTLAACEYIVNGEAVNLGTSKRYKIIDAVEYIFNYLDWHPKKIFFDRSKPEGVKTRALDVSKAKKLIGWTPEFNFKEGVKLTIDWMKSLPEYNHG